MTLSSDDLLRIVKSYPEGHHLRSFAEADDYPPGHMYLAYLGHALNTIERCCSGKEYERLLYERLRAGRNDFVKPQLYATLAEITVALWLERLGGEVDYQPVLSKGGRNPDIFWKWGGQEYEMETKCPDLFPSTVRAYELGARQDIVTEQRFRLPAGALEGVDLLPLDNKVKDFLVKANDQVTEKSIRPTTRYSLLCIAWSHKEKEALAYLLGLSGLLTQRSYYRDSDDRPVLFPNIDAVLVVDVLGVHNDWFARDGAFGNPFLIQNSRRYLVQNPGSSIAIPKCFEDALGCLKVDEAWVDKNVSQLHSTFEVPAGRKPNA